MSTAVSHQGPRPFLSAPDPRRYFPAAAIEEARRRLVRCIERSEGPALLIGGAGCGKSLLLEVLAGAFCETHSVARLTGAQLCTRRALLQTILFELSLPYRGLDEGELRLAILRRLRGGESTSRRVLVLVDEADTLPSRLLEELRVLTNVVAEGHPVVHLVLAGRPALEERFADPQLDGFSQRLAVRAYLSPLTRNETLRYVRSQVAAVGWEPDAWFTPSCLEAVFQATDGVPRLINQLGDQLIVGAEGQDALPLGAEEVQQTWSELQQLPVPWTEPAVAVVPSLGPARPVVEFADLCDPSAEAAAPDQAIELVAMDEEDDLPASIPFDMRTFAAVAECHVVEQEDHDATDPFAEPFDEEEVIVDPYAGFESTLLAASTQVVNSLDVGLGDELRRLGEAPIEAAPTAEPPAPPQLSPAVDVEDDHVDTEIDEPDPWEVVEPTASRFQPVRIDAPATPPHRGDLLVVEDDDERAPRVVPSRQFRRLFSALESGSPLTPHR